MKWKGSPSSLLQGRIAPRRSPDRKGDGCARSVAGRHRPDLFSSGLRARWGGRFRPGSQRFRRWWWCGRPGSNRQGLTPDGFSYHFGFHRRLKAFVVWTIPSPCFGEPKGRCCPSSLYTFPRGGLARDRHFTGFPEFEQFCTGGFPLGTQAWFKSVASTSFATPA